MRKEIKQWNDVQIHNRVFFFFFSVYWNLSANHCFSCPPFSVRQRPLFAIWWGHERRSGAVGTGLYCSSVHRTTNEGNEIRCSKFPRYAHPHAAWAHNFEFRLEIFSKPTIVHCSSRRDSFQNWWLCDSTSVHRIIRNSSKADVWSNAFLIHEHLRINDNRRNNNWHSLMFFSKRCDGSYIYDSIDFVLCSEVENDILNMIDRWIHFQDDTSPQNFFGTTTANLERQAKFDFLWQFRQTQLFRSIVRVRAWCEKELELDCHWRIDDETLFFRTRSFDNIDCWANLSSIYRKRFSLSTDDVFWIGDLSFVFLRKGRFEF